MHTALKLTADITILPIHPYKSGPTQPSLPHFRSSLEFPNTNLRQIGHGLSELWSDIKTNRHKLLDLVQNSALQLFLTNTEFDYFCINLILSCKGETISSKKSNSFPPSKRFKEKNYKERLILNFFPKHVDIGGIKRWVMNRWIPSIFQFFNISKTVICKPKTTSFLILCQTFFQKTWMFC